MPLPPPSFTQSKWLAFFSELKAKITHHNILVSIEGCETLKRLLITHISIAALLQEGDLLQSLLDIIIGCVRSERLPGHSAILNEELTLYHLETLSLCIDMMVALYADGDAYYGLLVLARAGGLIEGLLGLLQRPHPHFHGTIAILLARLLSLPIGHSAPKEIDQIASTPLSVSLRRHLEELCRLVSTHGGLLQEVVDTLSAIVATCQGPPRVATMRLLHTASPRLQKHALHRPIAASGDTAATAASSIVDDSELNVTITGAADVKSGVLRTGGAERAAGEGEDAHVEGQEPAEVPFEVPEVLFDSVFEALQMCRSHDEFFTVMSDVWCLTVAKGPKLAERFTAGRFASVRRFMVTAPVTRQDRCVFIVLLLWLGHLMSFFTLQPDTRDEILKVSGSALLNILRNDCTKRNSLSPLPASLNSPIVTPLSASGAPVQTGAPFSTLAASIEGLSTPHALHHLHPQHSMLSPLAPGFSSIGASSGLTSWGVEMAGSPLSPRVPALTPNTPLKEGSPSRQTRSKSCAKGGEGALLETPSVAVIIMSFLLNVERACRVDEVEQWVRVGNVLGLAGFLIRQVENVKSVLIDTPTTMDGSLSDEVYLNGALRAVRTDDIALAVLSCKLVASLLWSHFPAFQGDLRAEMSAAIQTLVPLLLKIALHNPTVTSARECVASSALYHSPTGPRSSRYTSLGECAVVALDACLGFHKAAQLHDLCLGDLLGSLPLLSRCTRHSIHPALRSVVYRVLMHLCEAPSDLLLAIEAMPSLLNTAVGSVLEYNHKTAPQWGTAAAAEWLCSVLDIASTDVAMEGRFNLTRTVLAERLIELAASSPIGYATTALLRLVLALCAQEERLAKSTQKEAEGENNNKKGVSFVLAPHGWRSLNSWFALIRLAADANGKLSHLDHSVSACSGDALDRSGTPQHCGGAGGAGLQVGVPTKDALSRALSVAENIAVQYTFTGSLFCCLKKLFMAFPEYRKEFANPMVCGLFANSFSVPPPHRVIQLLSCWFDVRMDEHPLLTMAYDGLIQWACELAPVWFDTDRVATDVFDFKSVPSAIFESLSSIMKNASIPQRARHHVPLFVCSLLVLPTGGVPEGSAMTVHSVSLFDASLALKQSTCVSGMQCRLVRTFLAANERAQRCGWFAQRVRNLQRLIKALVENAGVLGDDDGASFLVELSLVGSVIAHPECAALSHEMLQMVCEALCEGIRFRQTRLATLQCVRSIAHSSEGRRCLLHEITVSGEPLARSCFGRLLALTLNIPTTWGLQQDRLLASKSQPSRILHSPSPRRSGGRGPQRSSSPSVRGRAPALSLFSSEPRPSKAVELGYDICTAVCGKGGAPFIQAFLKHRGVRTLETLFRAYDRSGSSEGFASGGRGVIPLPLLRLTAAISFHAEAQRAIFQQPVLWTILIELAGEVGVGGGLALLGLRNLCFNAGLKTVLCQDPRVLLTLKGALQKQRTLAPLLGELNNAGKETPSKGETKGRNEREGRAGVVPPSSSAAVVDWAKKMAARLGRSASPREGGGGPTPAALQAELTRRQELAVSALWALLYDHRRGRAEIRAVLQQAPSMDVAQILPTELLKKLRLEPQQPTGFQPAQKDSPSFQAVGEKRDVEIDGNCAGMHAGKAVAMHAPWDASKLYSDGGRPFLSAEVTENV